MASGIVISRVLGVTTADFRDRSMLDGSSVEQVGSELYALVDQQAVRKLVVNFRSVKFLSSQMLGVLIALDKKIRAIDGRLVICGLRPELLKVFKMTRLDKALNLADNEDQAVSSFDAFMKS